MTTEAIPLLTSTLGYTYDVPRGKYAEATSCKRQIISWENYLTSENSYVESYGGKEYLVPKLVDFRADTTSSYETTFGNSIMDYSKELSVNASVSVEFPGFSGSATADYSQSERTNVANSFTRISYNITHYIISLPPTEDIRGMLDLSFLVRLESAARAAANGYTSQAFSLFDNFGTHLLRSVVIGGRGAFLSVTDSRKYTSQTSIAASAKISASYAVVSGSASLSTAEKEAMENFNSSSTTSVRTEGGNPMYGNENFVKHVSEWAQSIMTYPSFIDFGPNPSLIGIWEFLSTPELVTALKKTYGPYTMQYSSALALSGPYLNTRVVKDADIDPEYVAKFYLNEGNYAALKYPRGYQDGWYLISPGTDFPIIAREIGTVSAVLAPVTWTQTITHELGDEFTIMWKAIPPSNDYVALGSIGFTCSRVVWAVMSAIGKPNPPGAIADRFRAVHKSALAVSTTLSDHWKRANNTLYKVDGYFHIASPITLTQQDCFGFKSEMIVKDNY